MSNQKSGDRQSDSDEETLDPAAARIVTRVRRLMLIPNIVLILGVAAVFGTIGYRVFKSGESAVVPADVASALPKGAKVTGVTAAEDRIVVTIELNGATEIRTFDLKTLKPAGRLSFPVGP